MSPAEVAVHGGGPAAMECVATALETAAPLNRKLGIDRLKNLCPLMATIMASRR